MWRLFTLEKIWWSWAKENLNEREGQSAYIIYFCHLVDTSAHFIFIKYIIWIKVKIERLFVVQVNINFYTDILSVSPSLQLKRFIIFILELSYKVHKCNLIYTCKIWFLKFNRCCAGSYHRFNTRVFFNHDNNQIWVLMNELKRHQISFI